MVMTKIALAGLLAAAIVAICAGYDSWRNRKKYAARERKRETKGGLQ
jgi:uncharacterized iron-regulated membrane protein